MSEPIHATSAPATLAPLPVPEVNRAMGRVLKRLRQRRVGQHTENPAALVPLLYAALSFVTGIVAARFAYFRPGWLVTGLALLALGAVAAIAGARRVVWLPLTAVWLVLGMFAAETESEPAPNRRLAQLSDGLLRTVEGTAADVGPMQRRGLETVDAASNPEDGVESDSEESAEQGEQSQRVDLRMDRVEDATDDADSMVAVPTAESARIRLTIRWPGGQAREFHCGERIRAVIRILPSDAFHDPGVWSRTAYLETQEITAEASVNAAKADGGEPRLSRLGDGGSTSAACLLNRWRDWSANRLQRLPEVTRRLPGTLHAMRATPEDAAMLTALVTGDRSYLTRNLRVGFERTGSFHLIVVSGLHLAILAGGVFALARRLRLQRFWATAVTLAATLAYALFTGFAVPAQRSFWMIALYLVGRLLYRNRSPLNAIGFAAIALAAASPRCVFEASLQMTLLAVAAIAGVAVPLLANTLHARVKATGELRLIALDSRLPVKIAQFRVVLRLICGRMEAAFGAGLAWRIFPFALRLWLSLGELLFVTLVVELALALPMAMYFHRITLYALPVNLLILPLLTILVPTAMLTMMAMAIWPAAALVPAVVSLSVLHFSLWVVRVLGSLSLGDLRIPEPARMQVALALLLFILALQLARGGRWQRCLSLAALLGMTTAALWPRWIEHPRDALLFEAIDVGQGDALLLISPDGKTLLVDGGGLGFFGKATHTHSEFDVGEEVVSPVLWSRGIRRLDAVALTHAHHDHMGGLAAVLRNFRPKELWVGKNPPVPAYLDLLKQARDLGVVVRAFHAGESLALGAVELRVLAPGAGYRPGAQPANNDSLVIRGRFGNTSVLLAADAEGPEENVMLSGRVAGNGTLHSDLLKIGHHGSLTSTHAPFLAAVAPQWAVISCGRGNRFGHPRGEVLSELQRAGTRTFRTDTEGAVCFQLDGRSVSVEPFCREP